MRSVSAGPAMATVRTPLMKADGLHFFGDLHRELFDGFFGGHRGEGGDVHRAGPVAAGIGLVRYFASIAVGTKAAVSP